MNSTNTNNTFPIKVLTPIAADQGPNHTNLTILQSELNSDAMSIPSTLTTFGHLVLTVTTPVYITHCMNLFPPPLNLGLTPVHARNAPPETIAETNRQHRILREDYALYHKTDNDLKGILLQAVPPIFVQAIKHPTLGFGNQTTLAILTHLWDNYGVIDDDMLADNLVALAAHWAPPTPIEAIIARITDYRAFARTGGDPISQVSAVCTATVIMEGT